MAERIRIDPPTRKSDRLARRILTLIGIVIFLGLPLYGGEESSD